MRIRFWGTRGSIAPPGPDTNFFGGNPSCVELTTDAGDVVIFDCGTGAHPLAGKLMAQGNTAINANLLIGHTHWDHIQGFPFFAPAYDPNFHIDIYGAPGFGKDLESIFRGQLDGDYFPVEMSEMAAQLSFHRLEENPVTFGDVQVAWEFMNHPGATVGFRI